jgi:hypothetical protein
MLRLAGGGLLDKAIVIRYSARSRAPAFLVRR